MSPPFLADGFGPLIWVIIVVIYVIVSFFKKLAEGSGDGQEQKEMGRRREMRHPSEGQPPPTPNQPSQSAEEEEMRKFLEALGLPQTPVTRKSPPPPPPPPRSRPAPPPVPVAVDEEMTYEPKSLIGNEGQALFTTDIEKRSQIQHDLDAKKQVDDAAAFIARAQSAIGPVSAPSLAYEIAAKKPFTRRTRLKLTHSELRRAIILREVLGPPKGLES